MPSTCTRRKFLTAAAIPVAGLLGSRATGAAERTLRFSYQRSSTLLTLLKENGAFEQKFGAQGYDVSWHLFGSVLAPMNAASVDFHADVADAVPIFTQAAGAPLTIYAKEAASPAAEAIIVHADSPIKTIADLRGKTIGVSQGSGCHFLLAAVLSRHGLSFQDIKPAYLESADGNAAFQRRSIDAWVIWDPFLAITQSQFETRTIADATGYSSYCRYYLVNDRFVAEHPEIVQAVFEALVETGRWVKSNPRRAAEILGPLWGDVPMSTVEIVNSRRSYAVEPVDRAALAEQQKIADTFFEAGLIPARIAAAEARIWQAARN